MGTELQMTNEPMVAEPRAARWVTGQVAPAIIAAGIGVFFIGLLTVLAEASTSFSNAMN